MNCFKYFLHVAKESIAFCMKLASSAPVQGNLCIKKCHALAPAACHMNNLIIRRDLRIVTTMLRIELHNNVFKYFLVVDITKEITC